MHVTNEEHSHCGCGCGGHEHTHDHCTQPKNEDEAVLAYMLDHNRHHAQELVTIAAHLREQGKEDVAKQIDKAVEDFEKGNMRLSIAVSLIQ